MVEYQPVTVTRVNKSNRDACPFSIFSQPSLVVLDESGHALFIEVLRGFFEYEF